jgi:hypothetical protein
MQITLLLVAFVKKKFLICREHRVAAFESMDITPINK